jgi:putative ABC transport system permease protein
MNLRLALRNLLRNRRRTAAVLLTVGAGSASLFLFDGFNFGIMNQYRSNTVHSRFGHGQLNTQGYRDTVHEKPWEHWISGWQEVARELRSLPGVKHVFPRVEFFSLLTNGRITVSGRGQGIDGEQEAQFFNTLNVEEGETLSTQPDGILLGRGLARALDAKVGSRVTVLSNTVHGSMNGADFTVAGIFHTGAKEFDDVVFRIPLPQAALLLDTDKVESIALGLEDEHHEKRWAEVARVAREKWPRLEATPFAVLDKVYYQHSVDWLNSQFAIIQLIILGIVVLGIFNTVSTGVMERKQEIGNLRANGESWKDVLRLLALEGLALGALGAAAGLVISYLLVAIALKDGILMPPAPGLTRQFHVMLEFQPQMAVTCFILGTSTALIGTVLAAVKVARMPIADLLRAT